MNTSAKVQKIPFYKNTSLENIHGEKWKDIPGYEGHYEASSKGRIKSLDKTLLKANNIPQSFKGKVLRQYFRKQYLCLQLNKGGVFRYCTVHRLIAKTFIPNPDMKPEVNHIDENKINNCSENLEWCTRKENMNHGSVGNRISLTATNGVKSKAVKAISKDNKEVLMFPSIAEARRKGFNAGCIGLCLNGKRKLHKGYHWSYN